MNLLSDRERELVALGAAMGSNCIPCIEYHVPQARKAGLRDEEIREAVELADRVRRVPARKVWETAHALLGEAGSGETGEAAERAPGGARAAPGKRSESPCCP